MKRMRMIIIVLIASLMPTVQLAAKNTNQLGKEEKLTKDIRKISYSDVISTMTLPNDGSTFLGFDLNGKIKGEDLYHAVEYMLQQLETLEISIKNYKENKKRHTIFIANKKFGFMDTINNLLSAGNSRRYKVDIRISKDETYEKLPVIIEVYYGLLGARWLDVFDLEVNYPFLKNDIHQMIRSLYQKIHPEILLVED